MSELTSATPRRSRAANIRQADVRRAIRGALEAGLEVLEVVATKDGIRIVSGKSAAISSNSWDEVLDHG